MLYGEGWGKRVGVGQSSGVQRLTREIFNLVAEIISHTRASTFRFKTAQLECGDKMNGARILSSALLEAL